MELTYRYRIKDATSGKRLDRMAVGVNQVWNYCGGVTEDARRLNRRWASDYDLINLTSGSSKDLGLHSDTVQGVCKQFALSRQKARKRPKWRVSFGKNKSLGWIPFQSGRALQIAGNTVTFLRKKYKLWLSRAIPTNIRSGCFAQDAMGHWYLNLVCRVEADLPAGTGQVGIDLGLKDFAALSTGQKIPNPRHLRNSAARLARAQRAGRRKAARLIYRKIANQRKHFLHETYTHLVRRFADIFVGDVRTSFLLRSNMAKSVLDAGWGMFRSMLSYKAAMRPGARCVHTNEQYSTQTCSVCHERTGPQGRAGLHIRQWECISCGTLHDRDINAATNILLSGQSIVLPLLEIPVL